MKKSKIKWKERQEQCQKKRKRKERERDEGRKVEKWNESERNWKQCKYLKKGINK